MMLGATIQTLRLERRLTEEELGRQVGVSESAIQMYERNAWQPGTEVLQNIAKALGVSTAELTEGYSILVDEEGKMLLVRHLGGNLIRVVGEVKEEMAEHYRKEVERLCGDTL